MTFRPLRVLVPVENQEKHRALFESLHKLRHPAGWSHIPAFVPRETATGNLYEILRRPAYESWGNKLPENYTDARSGPANRCAASPACKYRKDSTETGCAVYRYQTDFP